MILYFSGTGNSKYVAQRMAEALNQSLLSMNDRIRSHDTSPVETDERLVIVTPTYAWRIPRLVRDWLLETEFPGAAQVWFIMTCGSEIGHASRYNRSLCQTKGLTDMGTAQIIMPENYIAMFDAPQAEEARRIVAKAQPDIDRSIAAVREGHPFPPPHDRLYDRFMSGPVNPIFYACFVKSSAFTVSEACTGCGQCVRRCPTNSITLRPVWAKAAPTAWPVSATAPRPPSSTEKRASASPGITSRPCKPSRQAIASRHVPAAANFRYCS